MELSTLVEFSINYNGYGFIYFYCLFHIMVMPYCLYHALFWLSVLLWHSHGCSAEGNKTSNNETYIQDTRAPTIPDASLKTCVRKCLISDACLRNVYKIFHSHIAKITHRTLRYTANYITWASCKFTCTTSSFRWKCNFKQNININFYPTQARLRLLWGFQKFVLGLQRSH
jgi:hypothetical protein